MAVPDVQGYSVLFLVGFPFAGFRLQLVKAFALPIATYLFIVVGGSTEEVQFESFTYQGILFNVYADKVPSSLEKTASKRSPFTTNASAVSFRLMFPFSGTNIGFSLLDSLNCSVATS